MAQIIGAWPCAWLACALAHTGQVMVAHNHLICDDLSACNKWSTQTVIVQDSLPGPFLLCDSP